MRSKAIGLVLVLTLVAVGAGCGSKKSATKTESSSGATTTATTTSGSGGSGGGGGNGATPSFASTKNCVQLAAVGQKLSQAMAATSGQGTSSLTTVASVYKALASAAPSEIRPDFETIAAAFGTYASAVQKAGYTPGKAPTAAQMAALSSLAKTFSSPKLAAAEQHLSAWGSKNCGGLTSTNG